MQGQNGGRGEIAGTFQSSAYKICPAHVSCRNEMLLTIDYTDIQNMVVCTLISTGLLKLTFFLIGENKVVVSLTCHPLVAQKLYVTHSKFYRSVILLLLYYEDEIHLNHHQSSELTPY